MEKRKKRRRYALLTAGLLALMIPLDQFYGNPISRLWARHTAQQYLQTRYADTGFYIADMGYNFKNNGYSIDIASPTSIDSHFELRIKKFDPTWVYLDSYASRVLSGRNTEERLNRMYQDLVDPVIEGEDFPYARHTSCNEIACTSRDLLDSTGVPAHTLLREELVLDGVYDIREVAADYGRLVIYLEDEAPTPALAAEMLLEIRRRMDEAGVPFYCIDFALKYADRHEWRIDINNFLYEDIHPEGLIARICAADKKTTYNYTVMDLEWKINALRTAREYQ